MSQLQTALPGKIDDFEASCKWQQGCPRFIRQGQLLRVGRGERIQMALKGRF